MKKHDKKNDNKILKKSYMKENLRLFKSLGAETTYLIVESLLLGERCACELPKIIGRTQSNTSMHLAKLLDLGILKSRKEGKCILYSIKDKRIYVIFNAIKKRF
jgi:ArsR family transcriptional regulator, lead/cadmium/zinc/bismuth-responsive transcriptional repressor